MITAEAARSITKSSIANLRNTFPFKYAIKKIEMYVKEAASNGKQCFSCNICELIVFRSAPSLVMRKAIAEELRKNGFSCTEICKNDKSVWSVWFEVSW